MGCTSSKKSQEKYLQNYNKFGQDQSHSKSQPNNNNFNKKQQQEQEQEQCLTCTKLMTQKNCIENGVVSSMKNYPSIHFELSKENQKTQAQGQIYKEEEQEQQQNQIRHSTPELKKYGRSLLFQASNQKQQQQDTPERLKKKKRCRSYRDIYAEKKEQYNKQMISENIIPQQDNFNLKSHSIHSVNTQNTHLKKYFEYKGLYHDKLIIDQDVSKSNLMQKRLKKFSQHGQYSKSHNNLPDNNIREKSTASQLSTNDISVKIRNNIPKTNISSLPEFQKV